MSSDIGVAGSLHEWCKIHRGPLVDLAVENRIDDVSSVRGRLRGVYLKLRSQKSSWSAILRREVTEHAGCIEEILAQIGCLVVHGAIGRQSCIQSAQNVWQEQHRLALVAKGRI